MYIYVYIYIYIYNILTDHYRLRQRAVQLSPVLLCLYPHGNPVAASRTALEATRNVSDVQARCTLLDPPLPPPPFEPFFFFFCTLVQVLEGP